MADDELEEVKACLSLSKYLKDVDKAVVYFSKDTPSGNTILEKLKEIDDGSVWWVTPEDMKKDETCGGLARKLGVNAEDKLSYLVIVHRGTPVKKIEIPKDVDDSIVEKVIEIAKKKE